MQQSEEKSRNSEGAGWLKSFLHGPELSPTDSLVVHLQNAVEIEAVKKSNLISIAYTSQDPTWATEVVATLMDRYLETRAERFQSPQAVSFFETQMLQAQQRLVDSETALQRFASETSVTFLKGSDGTESLAAQKQMVMERLGELQSDLASAEVELNAQRRQVASLQQVLQREPERLESSNRENKDVAAEEIERAIATLKLQRDALLQDFKPDSRRVQDIDTQIKLAEDQLEERRRASRCQRYRGEPAIRRIQGRVPARAGGSRGSRFASCFAEGSGGGVSERTGFREQKCV